MHYSPGRLHLWHKEVKQFQPQPLEATSWKTKECSDWQYLSGAVFVNCKILPLAYGSACLSSFLQSNAEHPSSGFKQLDRGLLADFAFTSAPHVQHNLQVPFPTYPLLLWWWCHNAATSVQDSLIQIKQIFWDFCIYLNTTCSFLIVEGVADVCFNCLLATVRGSVEEYQLSHKGCCFCSQRKFRQDPAESLQLYLVYNRWFPFSRGDFLRHRFLNSTWLFSRSQPEVLAETYFVCRPERQPSVPHQGQFFQGKQCEIIFEDSGGGLLSPICNHKNFSTKDRRETSNQAKEKAWSDQIS